MTATGTLADTAVEIAGVSKRFKVRRRREPLTVLEDISLTMRSGSTVSM